MNLSFAGCGFLGIYHVGVVSCFREYAPNLVNELSGASAGAIAACCLICDCPLGLITSEILKVASSARTYMLGPFSPKFDVTGILRDRLNTILPSDAHIRCTGRLHVSATRVSDGKNVIMSEYNTREELIQALLCSSFIPIFSGIIPPTYRGVRYIDGCYSDNLPVLDENTVTVSPFCGECDICPRDNSYNLLQVNLANTSIELSTKNLYRFMRVLFPPHPEILSQMCKQGFDDALQFLQRNDLISCTRCIAVHSTLQLQETKVNVPLCDSDEEKDDEETEQHNCIECKQRKEVALLEDLPEAVLEVFEEACASMNKGLINWVFQHKSMRVLSVLTLPYVLPLDIAYVMCVKLMALIPKIGRDMNGLISNILTYVKNIIKKFNKHRHFYSAKFTCQLAITEYDYEAEEGYTIKPTLRLQSSPCRTGSLPPLDDNLTRRTSIERVLGRVNLDFTVDLASPSMADAGPLSSALSADTKERTAVDIVNAALQWETQKPEDWDTQVDTFEQILEVTRKQDALMAYYYLDESNQMKVTEIFNVTDADTSALLPVEEREINKNLSWDEDWPEPTTGSTWLPPAPTRSATMQTQLDSVLDCSFDDLSSINSSDEMYGDSVFTDDDYFSLKGVQIDSNERKRSFAIMNQ